jgi:peptidoglycan/xylan/chitin deacetylase (PgdA/CDA1 family)
MKAITLLYHDVVEPGQDDASGFTGGSARRYKLEWPEFERHLRAVGATASPPIGVEDVLAGRSADQPLLLTFDDGGASARRIGEALAERGWRGHFLIPTDFLGRPGFLGRDDLLALADQGHVIGSHSCSHPDRMSACTYRRLLEEWTRSVALLAETLDAQVTVASVPGGYYSRRVARAASAAGIRALFTSEPVVRVRNVDGCAVFGRYSIIKGTSPRAAAQIACGRPWLRARQSAGWNTRKLVKAVGGQTYVRSRNRLLNRR